MESLTSLEILLVAAALGAAVVWLTARTRPRRRAAVMAAASAVLAMGAWTAASYRVVPLAEEEIPWRPIAVPEDGYVSSETCQSCHPREYETWHGSYHRSMTQLPGPSTVVGDFDAGTLELHGTRYRLARDGSLFWIELEVPCEAESPCEDGPTRLVKRPIVMTTGSHHLQAYWYPTGDRRNLAMFPFVYLIAEERWIPRESVFVRPPPEGDARKTPLPFQNADWPSDQRWNHTCIHCHTTHAQPRYAELDTRVAEFGIACESCHGPAEEHVRLNRDPRRRYQLHLGETHDDSIVQPLRLPHGRDSQVCGACHGVSYPDSAEELYQELGTGKSYRPGDDLAASRVIVQPSRGAETLRGTPDYDPRVREQSFWADGMVRVKGREYNGLIDSPCFERGELSCFSCHSMHQSVGDARPLGAWADDQLKPEMDADRACVQCHEGLGRQESLAEHTHHQAESSGSRCYNCHMPFTTYGLLKGIRSHQIESPSVSTSIATGRPNGCNQCHLDKTLGWTAEQLEAWYGTPRPELDDVRRGVPASLIWLLSGDATQRALMAWSMGWEPAREASGTSWMTPFLAQLLVDPYDAVRFNAGQSLRLQPGFGDFRFDFLGPAADRRAALQEARALWRDADPPPDQVADAASLLVDPQGTLPKNVFVRLLRQRNDRPVALAE